MLTLLQCMTALFRALGAAFPTFDSASKVSGLSISVVIMYMGYLINKTQMRPWLVPPIMSPRQNTLI